MPIVQYTDTKGFKWAVDVPEDTPREQYKSGIRIGPPNLSRFNLTIDAYRTLNNVLVDRGFYNAPMLVGKRSELKQILQQCGIPIHLLNSIIGVYQSILRRWENE
jgi:hypothetical protein